jgi:ribonuclease R
LDLTRLPIITIDGVRARDFDDAVCATREGNDFVLTVCIADVSEYVQIGSALDQEAYRRATSTYLPRECIPMLPEKLSNDLCSLREGEPRFVLGAEMRFNKRGEPQRARFFKGIIRSRKQTTYEEIQNYFDSRAAKDFPTDVVSSLGVMKELAETLQVRSRARGAMALELPETESVFDEKGVLTGFRRASRLFAHKLIEEFMIAANVAVAALFARQGLPQLFRVHDTPDEAKLATFLEMVRGAGLRLREEDIQSGIFLEQLRGHPLATYLQSVYLRSLKQAIYDPENRGHFGLALQDYCHFTSPIRRYPDLIVHRQLRCLLEKSADGTVTMDENRRGSTRPLGTTLPYSFADLTAIGRHTSRRERDAAETEREVVELEKVFFMQSRVGREYQGTVTRIVRFGAFIELDGDFVEGMLQAANLPGGPYEFDQKRVLLKSRRGRRALRIGDRVTVQVSRVDIETRRIELVVEGEGAWTSVAVEEDISWTRFKPKPFHERKGKKKHGKPDPKKSGGSTGQPLPAPPRSKRRKKRVRPK